MHREINYTSIPNWMWSKNLFISDFTAAGFDLISWKDFFHSKMRKNTDRIERDGTALPGVRFEEGPLFGRVELEIEHWENPAEHVRLVERQQRQHKGFRIVGVDLEVNDFSFFWIDRNLINTQFEPLYKNLYERSFHFQRLIIFRHLESVDEPLERLLASEMLKIGGHPEQKAADFTVQLLVLLLGEHGPVQVEGGLVEQPIGSIEHRTVDFPEMFQTGTAWIISSFWKCSELFLFRWNFF